MVLSDFSGGKNMKKCLTLCLCLTALLCLIFLTTPKAEAATYGDLTYKISNGEVTITDCNTSATGELVIPSTIDGYPVTTIRGCAFFYCHKLTSITIPDSVTNIGSHAFYDCTSLTGIWVDENNPIYCSDSYGVLYVKNRKVLIAAPGAIQSCVIPDSVTTIGDSAFFWCTSLTSVTIPDSVTTIGDRAFYGCTSLSSVTIPNSVVTIYAEAFAWCESLKTITIPDSYLSGV